MTGQSVGSAGGVEAPPRGGDCQSRLDKIELLIGVYRMRYMHYVWQDHMPEAGEMTRKIDRLLERWQRVRDAVEVSDVRASVVDLVSDDAPPAGRSVACRPASGSVSNRAERR